MATLIDLTGDDDRPTAKRQRESKPSTPVPGAAIGSVVYVALRLSREGAHQGNR
jgi:hypothetical protein